jgi:hypothetical protein
MLRFLVEENKMEKMTLSRALRYKKRVIEKIRKFESDVQESNCKVEGEARDVDPAICLKQRAIWVNHLVDLKLAIQEATRPIQRLILELAEAKANIGFLQRIPTTHGSQRPRYRDEASVKYEAVIRKSQVDSSVASQQDVIDNLQTKIDLHNAETVIEINTPELP